MYDMFYYESVCYVYKNLIVKYCQQTILDLTLVQNTNFQSWSVLAYFYGC